MTLDALLMTAVRAIVGAISPVASSCLYWVNVRAIRSVHAEGVCSSGTLGFACKVRS